MGQKTEFVVTASFVMELEGDLLLGDLKALAEKKLDKLFDDSARVISIEPNEED